MSQIDDKYSQLKSHGLDLGAPLAAEEDAGSGGRVRRYQNGNIYYHPNTGAHEVHGGILSLYLAAGGPGANPMTGNRDLGFPITDEIDENTPYSMFEWGAIYWVRGTGGCVLFGSVYATYKANGGLGLPVTSVMKVAGGLAAYFEGGVVYSANGGGNVHHALVGSIAPPMLGRPAVVDPSVEETRRFYDMVTYHLVARDDYNALVAWRPSIFTDLWNERLYLTAVGKPDARLALTPFQTHNVESVGQVDVHVYLEAFPNGPVDLTDRTLYDLRLAQDAGRYYVLSPHCLYAKKGWTDFGLLHVTDIHISGRNERFRDKLNSKGLPDAAAHYSNFQDNFRDFIKYANHLHDTGQADIVFATGDLIDYVEEDGDTELSNNFRRLRNLILGTPMNDGDLVGEELRLPFFPSFGNHDYRITPYWLRSDIDPVADYHATTINQYGDHNLIESEAIALQDGNTPSWGLTDLGDALQMLQWDRNDNKYVFFKQRFTGQRSYVVKLGPHRLVMLDTKMDDGVPQEINLDFYKKLIFGGLDPETQRIMDTGSANLVGLNPDELSMLRNAVVEAGQDGLVIVGIHSPAVVPSGEYFYRFRETVHPSVAAEEIAAYVSWHKFNGSDYPTGTSYFKTGDGTNGLDSGAFNEGNSDFLKACAGVGLARPVDLILCGHKHDWSEHRWTWNAAANRLEFYWDFYTENPSIFYSSINHVDRPQLPKGSRIQVQVDKHQTQDTGVILVRDHREGPATAYGMVRVPPYGQTLNDATDAKAWWQSHRPLQAMTSALGPIESRQRFGTFYKEHPPVDGIRPVVEFAGTPDVPSGTSLEAVAAPLKEPTFQGFRVVQVHNNVIQKMHYVTLADLRAKNFHMPWEGGRWGGVDLSHIGDHNLQIGTLQ